MKLTTFLVFFLLGFNYFLQGAEETFYINRGHSQMVDTSFIPTLAFNNNPVFSQQNSIIHLLKGETLTLKIVNNDSLPHSIKLAGLALQHIMPGDSAVFQTTFHEYGIYPLYDSASFPAYHYMGLSTMVVVSDIKHQQSYYWNISEHQPSINNAIHTGSTPDFSDYKPRFFTLNGLSYPHIENDPSAVIKAKVGDTVMLYVMNSGLGAHSLHFHGFHLEVLFDSHNNKRKGWSKDTFPFHPHHSMILMMVPDKPGYYPVHDHNLTAVTGNHRYPNGIFLIMDISE